MIFVPLVFALVVAVQASPSPNPDSGELRERQAITALTTAQIDAFTPYTWYASAAYCEPSVTATWTCGTNCEANPSFIPTASGGDGSDTQFWYVGYDPTLETVVVGHQGTDTSEIIADLLDADFFLTSLDSTLFPGLPSDLEVHSGFQDSHNNAAPDVLAAVQTTLANHATNLVTIVGHSLGAAIAELDAVFLPLHLPSTVSFQTIGFGKPRVGNQAWANYVSTNAPLTHINNEEDFIPILPGLTLGFHHPTGEVHIEDSGEWAACPGQDNPSTSCTRGDVPNIFEGDESNHDGPYNGITIHC